MSGDAMLRSRADPDVAVDPAEVGRAVEELFPEALGVWVYGSFADGYARRDSDIDIAILPDRAMDVWNLRERAVTLEDRLGREVDFVDLRRVGTVLRFEIAVRGVRVAARDPFACDLFETAAIAMFQRLSESQREHLAEIRARGSVA
jgi:uncharacterized protein